MCKQGEPGTVVVGQRGVADVGREQYFILVLAPVKVFSVWEEAVFETRVDDDLVSIVFQLSTGDASGRSPVLSVV